ncbi:MAG: AAA family ATPase, partial [Myxococcota bacterium]
EQEPERLSELGWEPDEIRRIHRSFCRTMPSRSLLSAPEAWSLTKEQAEELLRRYGGRALSLLQRDPYFYLCDVGVRFAEAEQVAVRRGMTLEDPRRLRAALLNVLTEAAEGEGHSVLSRQELLARTRSQRFQLHPLQAEQALQGLEQEGCVQVIEGGPWGTWVGRDTLVEEERSIAKALSRFCDFAEQPIWCAPPPDLNVLQREVVLAIQRYRCVLLTGGPGTGKTHTMKSILSLGLGNVILTAPTGKATKRLQEMTGAPAQTLHRLLEYHPKLQRFGRHQDRCLEADLIVVDEAAMLDIVLMAGLLRALDPQKTRLLLCGDANQLPSVGAGNVFADVLNARKLPTVELTEVVRQEKENHILPNARRVLAGQPLRVDNQQCADFKFFPVRATTQVEERQHLLETLEQIYQKLREKGFADDQIQLLSPMKKGEIPGAYALNDVLQKLLRSGVRGPFIQAGTQSLYIGDRVIQRRNDYEREVFNGDTGLVVGVDNGLRVRFEQSVVEYSPDCFTDVELSYAISIHKSQGSEWPVVILPLSLSHKSMLSRKLLYTAMTRAQRLLILLGDARAVAHAVAGQDEADRFTSLPHWLNQSHGFSSTM